jgi:hypothetical protein
MDVLRAAHGRLDACDYGCVKGAFLEAHRLRIGASALQASHAEVAPVVAALLATVPLTGATEAVRARLHARTACGLGATGSPG